MTTNSTTAEDRLAKLGIYLPAAPTAFGAYVPAVQTGNLLFLSEMLATSGHTPTVIATLPENILMDAEEMVNASLVGLDLGEVVTIPSLPDIADWQAYEAARQNLIPKLSLSSPAVRYRVTALHPIGGK